MEVSRQLVDAGPSFYHVSSGIELGSSGLVASTFIH